MPSLADAKPGPLQCLEIEGEGDEVKRLKRLGICRGRVIHVLQCGDPMIVEVIGARIGLSRRLARRVSVEPAVETVPNIAGEGVPA